MLMCLASFAMQAQELVPNPSFETVSTCPTFASMLGNAEPWFNPTGGTPELYHGCAGSGSYAGVPANSSGGFQYARTGQGFAGIYTYRTGISGMREYIEVPLLAPLVPDQCYRFTMYVNMPDDFELACDGAGVHFSEGIITSGGVGMLPVDAHIEHPAGAIITDSVGWTEISGIYTAMGGEDHLTIGNFRSDAETSTIMFNPGTWYTGQAYLLVDDVSLVPIEDDLDLGPDTMVCGNGSFLLDATVPNAQNVLWNDGVTTAIRTITGSGEYSVEVDLGGCILRDTVMIELRPLPVLDLGADQVICNGTEFQINASIDAESTLLWDDGSTDPIRMIDSSGTFHATATNSCGTVTDEVLIEFEECPEEIYIPNAFTPNGDGINDVFSPVFDHRIWLISFTIHDRWGHELFRTSDHGSAWNAMDAPIGIYVVTTEAVSLSDPLQHHRSRGHVAVLR